ncbi:MAG: hypothetical protein K2N35_15075 [Muribaculaceae bacterium]|nr:hypothetical protein [Muribaculaceae bacterium]
MGWRREPRGKLYATNWLGDISTSADFPAVQVQFKNTRAGFYLNSSKLSLEIGDLVAVEAANGHDIGQVTMIGPLVRMQMAKAKLDADNLDELKKVFRKARPADIERFDEARSKEHSTMIKSRAIAEELGLNMKIGDVEYQGDGSKAIFYYIADERVDFRKLIRILAEEFKVRIEMKQIGARQETGRIGGIGPCGRPLCCSSWMTHFVSVGTGAARIQDLSMNPQKLAGQCAKLKCCLNFEIDAYAEAVKQLPPKETILQTKDADFFLFKTDILTRMLTYSTDKRMGANLTVIPASRAFEIIALNKQGIRPDKLVGDANSSEERREYIDLTDQDALTRFDKAKKKKQKHKQGNQGNQAAQAQKNSGKKPMPEKQEASEQENPGAGHKSGNQRRNKRKQNNKDQKTTNTLTHDPKEA